MLVQHARNHVHEGLWPYLPVLLELVQVKLELEQVGTGRGGEGGRAEESVWGERRGGEGRGGKVIGGWWREGEKCSYTVCTSVASPGSPM